LPGLVDGPHTAGAEQFQHLQLGKQAGNLGQLRRLKPAAGLRLRRLGFRTLRHQAGRTKARQDAGWQWFAAIRTVRGFICVRSHDFYSFTSTHRSIFQKLLPEIFGREVYPVPTDETQLILVPQESQESQRIPSPWASPIPWPIEKSTTKNEAFP